MSFCFLHDILPADHYVFSEDHPEDSQDEVRTVEEEALFRLAYPHVVELYLREKAENKTKSKVNILWLENIIYSAYI